MVPLQVERFWRTENDLIWRKIFLALKILPFELCTENFCRFDFRICEHSMLLRRDCEFRLSSNNIAFQHDILILMLTGIVAKWAATLIYPRWVTSLSIHGYSVLTSRISTRGANLIRKLVMSYYFVSGRLRKKCIGTGKPKTTTTAINNYNVITRV